MGVGRRTLRALADEEPRIADITVGDGAALHSFLRFDVAQRQAERADLGGDGEPSFGAAQSLKVGARNALAAGDIESAQSQAQAALKMLQDLAAAGENTYGFAGFIGELQAIELAANDLEQTNAEEKIQSIRDSMEALKTQAAQLKDSPISFKMDDASIAAVRAQIEALAAALGQQLVIPVTVAHPDGPIVPDLPPIPGFATGTNNAPPGMAWFGEDGPELVSFRGGETVYPADVSRNLAAMMEGIKMPASSQDSLLAGAMSAPSAPRFPHLGRLDINAGGQTIPAYIDLDFAKKLSRTAIKLGRTHN